MSNNKDIIHYDGQKKDKTLSIINKLLIVFIVILVIAIIIFTFFISPTKISGTSMVPTLQNGQHIFYAKVGYSLNAGDIVLFISPLLGEKQLIKRIIGVEGDTIKFDLTENTWKLNGKKLEEKYTNIYATNDTYSLAYFNTADPQIKDALTTSKTMTIIRIIAIVT